MDHIDILLNIASHVDPDDCQTLYALRGTCRKMQCLITPPNVWKSFENCIAHPSQYTTTSHADTFHIWIKKTSRNIWSKRYNVGIYGSNIPFLKIRFYWGIPKIVLYDIIGKYRVASMTWKKDVTMHNISARYKLELNNNTITKQSMNITININGKPLSMTRPRYHNNKWYLNLSEFQGRAIASCKNCKFENHFIFAKIDRDSYECIFNISYLTLIEALHVVVSILTK